MSKYKPCISRMLSLVALLGVTSVNNLYINMFISCRLGVCGSDHCVEGLAHHRQAESSAVLHRTGKCVCM